MEELFYIYVFWNKIKKSRETSKKEASLLYLFLLLQIIMLLPYYVSYYKFLGWS